MKIVASEKPTSATVRLPKRVASHTDAATPTSVTTLLEMLNRLNPTADTLLRSGVSTRPNVSASECSMPPEVAVLTSP